MHYYTILYWCGEQNQYMETLYIILCLISMHNMKKLFSWCRQKNNSCCPGLWWSSGVVCVVSGVVVDVLIQPWPGWGENTHHCGEHGKCNVKRTNERKCRRVLVKQFSWQDKVLPNICKYANGLVPVLSQLEEVDWFSVPYNFYYPLCIFYMLVCMFPTIVCFTSLWPGLHQHINHNTWHTL